MGYTGVLTSIAAPTLCANRKSKVHKDTPASSCVVCSTTTSNEQENVKEFTYSRASPSVRWPHLKFKDNHKNSNRSPFTVKSPPIDSEVDECDVGINMGNYKGKGEDETTKKLGDDALLNVNGEQLEGMGRPSRTKVKKMNKLALKKDKDWRRRVQFLTDKILNLKSDEFVADVLDKKMVQMTPTDFCFVVKWVGEASWQRALEAYEWLNLRHWYSPNARMLATILGVLGKANQEMLALELFSRAEPEVGNSVQVYNAMMGVYARNGHFSKVKKLLDLMRERGLEPDLVSFNTLINARLKSGHILPNLAIELLDEVRNSGLRPDIITYNTLISACSRASNLEEAVKVFNDMEKHKCQPDLWTYNAMISVFGRCGFPDKAERLFKDLDMNGFFPDAVTYNSLLYAFAREGKTEKVRNVCEEMVKKGFGKDEMTYNTMIHMYGKRGDHDVAMQLYNEMKTSGRNPDVVTYTVLIDSLGKANKIKEAANVMSEMFNAGVKPTLRTYSALICGYAKVGRRIEAAEMFNCMLQSGIKPDHLAYSVMLDIHLRSNDTKKAMMLYQDMIDDGFVPDRSLYEAILQVLGRENNEESIQKVVRDLEEVCKLSPNITSSILVKGKCYDLAAKILRSAIVEGFNLDHDNLFCILSSYSSSGRHLEAIQLLNFIKEHVSGSKQFISEALIVIYCKADQLDAALDEYYRYYEFGLTTSSATMCSTLIRCCEENEYFSEASQIFSDMRSSGLEPSQDLYQLMAIVYCKLGFPETGHYLVDQAETSGISVQDVPIYTNLIEAYGKLKLLEKAENVMKSLRQRNIIVDRKVWNALIQAYAGSGCYEKARAAFNTMMKDGFTPTVENINSLMQALIIDGRLNELYVVVEELQDMGFKISKSSIILMLDAFAQAGNIFEVKKIYHGMKAAGYFPTMHLYRVMVGLLSRGKHVRDVEAMVSEMEEAGFKPDISIWNSMLNLYTKIEDFKKTVHVYQQIQEAGLQPNEDTYNILILMYCRDRRPQEGLCLMHEMKQLNLEPQLDTYKSLIAALCKQLMLEEAEELFEWLRSGGKKLNRSFYHLMMKMYRNSGNHDKAEKLLNEMKESGVEPTIATMHLLMTSYGSSGHPEEAEKVFNELKLTGATLGTLPHSSVIDAYLKNGDYNIAKQKLEQMKTEGLEPDHRIWTCFIRAASLCHNIMEARFLLTAIGDAGFDLPIRHANLYCFCFLKIYFLWAGFGKAFQVVFSSFQQFQLTVSSSIGFCKIMQNQWCQRWITTLQP